MKSNLTVDHLWLEFAKAALTGTCAHDDFGDDGHENSYIAIAQAVCNQADAMWAIVQSRGLRKQS